MAAGLVSFATGVLPFSSAVPARLSAVAGGVALVLGAALIRAAGRVPQVLLHVLVAVSSALVSVFVAASTTDTSKVVTSYVYVWIAVYSAWFHPRLLAALHIAGIGVGFAVALNVSDAPEVVETVGFVMTSVAVVCVAVNVLVVRLREFADHDQLTGLLTRRAFADAAERHMALADRSGQPLTVAIVDLNDFKRVNDVYGHAAGDEVLASLARTWSDAVRECDVLGRHGGDEFVLLMPATTEAQAGPVLERLSVLSDPDTWTAGIAQWAGEPLSQWLDAADADLYANKHPNAPHHTPGAA